MWLYYIYDLFTAPGVMMHELSHALFCLFARVRVHKVKLFQFGRTAGYVLHDEPGSFFQGMLISLGPLLVNSLISLFCFAKFKFSLSQWQPWVWFYFGLVVGLHAIPSSGDAYALFRMANNKVLKNPLVLIGYPVVLILYIFDFLKRIHLDWIYVIGLFFLGNIFLKK